MPRSSPRTITPHLVDGETTIGAEPARTPQDRIHGIAARIRSLRTRSGLTLDQLAAAAGLDKGYLSRLERREKTPSITTLMKLADAFDVELSQLFGDTVERSAITVVRAADRLPYGADRGGHAYQALFQDDGQHHLSAFIVEPGESGDRDIGEHAGDEMIFVLDGIVEVAFADHSVVLGTGDSMRFEGHLKHRLRRIGPARAQALVVVARDGAAREAKVPLTGPEPASRSRSPKRRES